MTICSYQNIQEYYGTVLYISKYFNRVEAVLTAVSLFVLFDKAIGSVLQK